MPAFPLTSLYVRPLCKAMSNRSLSCLSAVLVLASGRDTQWGTNVRIYAQNSVYTCLARCHSPRSLHPQVVTASTPSVAPCSTSFPRRVMLDICGSVAIYIGKMGRWSVTETTALGWCTWEVIIVAFGMAAVRQAEVKGVRIEHVYRRVCISIV